MNQLSSDESLEKKLVSYDSFPTNNAKISQPIEVTKTQLLHSIAYAMNNGHKKYGSNLLNSFKKLFDKNSNYSTTCELEGTDKECYEKVLSFEKSSLSFQNHYTN